MARRGLRRLQRRPTTFLVLTEDHAARAHVWRKAVSQHCGGCRVHTVMVGGAENKLLGRITRYQDAHAAALGLSTKRIPQDTLFLLVSCQHDELLRKFVNAGLFPRYVDSSRHQPSALSYPQRKAG